MTATNAFETYHSAALHAVTRNRLRRIMRTRRLEATRFGRERRNRALIKPNQTQSRACNQRTRRAFAFNNGHFFNLKRGRFDHWNRLAMMLTFAPFCALSDVGLILTQSSTRCCETQLLRHFSIQVPSSVESACESAWHLRVVSLRRSTATVAISA